MDINAKMYIFIEDCVIKNYQFKKGDMFRVENYDTELCVMDFIKSNRKELFSVFTLAKWFDKGMVRKIPTNLQSMA
jgi:hypothetical protein